MWKDARFPRPSSPASPVSAGPSRRRPPSASAAGAHSSVAGSPLLRSEVPRPPLLGPSLPTTVVTRATPYFPFPGRPQHRAYPLLVSGPPVPFPGNPCLFHTPHLHFRPPTFSPPRRPPSSQAHFRPPRLRRASRDPHTPHPSSVKGPPHSEGPRGEPVTPALPPTRSPQAAVRLERLPVKPRPGPSAAQPLPPPPPGAGRAGAQARR